MDLNLIPDISENQSVLQESLAQLSSIMEEPQVPITPVPLPVVTTTTPTAAELLRYKVNKKVELLTQQFI